MSSWLICYPGEIARLFWNGHIVAPDGNRWEISFAPGLVASWQATQECGRSSWKCLKWALSPSGHGRVIEWVWNTSVEAKDSLMRMLCGTGSGFSQGLDQVVGHWQRAPFGWIFMICKNLLWNCFAFPLLKILSGVLGVVIGVPTLFLTSSVIGCLGKLVGGLVGSVGSFLGGVGALMGGTLLSGFIAVCALPNRFPRLEDQGTFGVYPASSSPLA